MLKRRLRLAARNRQGYLTAFGVASALLALVVLVPQSQADTIGFAPAASLAVGRFGAVAAPVPGGALVAGGSANGVGFVASAERYDESTNTWTSAGSMSVPRFQAIADPLPNGDVLVAGGQNPGVVAASAEIYHAGTNQWTDTAPMDTPRYDAASVVLQDGSVLVIGGSNGGSGAAQFSDSAERFDPSTDTWSDAGTFTTGRVEGTATVLDDGRVLYAAGADDNGSVTDADLYDPSTNTWTPTAPIPGARHGATASLLSSGSVLVAGGYEGGALASTEIYDPAQGTWSDGGDMTERRSQAAQATLPDGSVIVVGGIVDATCPPCSIVSDTADIYQAGVGWSSIPLDHPRYFETATTLADGSVLVAGGADDAGAINNIAPHLLRAQTPASADFTEQAVATVGLFHATISPPPSITTTALPIGVVGTAYGTSMLATGGTSPYTWSLAGGTLPAGLKLSPGGVISGRPTKAVAVTLSIRVTDAAAKTQSASLSLTVYAHQPANDGSGTATISPATAKPNSTKHVFTLKYTAPSTGTLINGTVQITIPAGWTAPSISKTSIGRVTTSSGTLAVSGSLVTITGLNLAKGQTLTVTYGSVASGRTGVKVPGKGSYSFAVDERSVAGGTLTPIGRSPTVVVK